MERPRTRVNLVVLCPSNDLYFATCVWELGAIRTVLVPSPTALTLVNQLKVGVADLVSDLGERGDPSIVLWGNVATADGQRKFYSHIVPLHLRSPDEFGLDSISFGPRDQEKRVWHATSMTDTRPSLPACLKRTFLYIVSLLHRILKLPWYSPGNRYNRCCFQ